MSVSNNACPRPFFVPRGKRTKQCGVSQTEKYAMTIFVITLLSLVHSTLEISPEAAQKHTFHFFLLGPDIDLPEMVDFSEQHYRALKELGRAALFMESAYLEAPLDEERKQLRTKYTALRTAYFEELIEWRATCLAKIGHFQQLVQRMQETLRSPYIIVPCFFRHRQPPFDDASADQRALWNILCANRKLDLRLPMNRLKTMLEKLHATTATVFSEQPTNTSSVRPSLVYTPQMFADALYHGFHIPTRDYLGILAFTPQLTTPNSQPPVVKNFVPPCRRDPAESLLEIERIRAHETDEVVEEARNLSHTILLHQASSGDLTLESTLKAQKFRDVLKAFESRRLSFLPNFEKRQERDEHELSINHFVDIFSIVQSIASRNSFLGIPASQRTTMGPRYVMSLSADIGLLRCRAEAASKAIADMYRHVAETDWVERSERPRLQKIAEKLQMIIRPGVRENHHALLRKDYDALKEHLGSDLVVVNCQMLGSFKNKKNVRTSIATTSTLSPVSTDATTTESVPSTLSPVSIDATTTEFSESDHALLDAARRIQAYVCKELAFNPRNISASLTFTSQFRHDHPKRPHKLTRRIMAHGILPVQYMHRTSKEHDV